MNRKILSVLLVLLMKISISSAQIHLDSANANLHIVGDRFTLQHATVQVINTGITNLTSVVAERSIVSLAPGHRAYFCWGVFCYDTLTNLSPHAQTIVGGAANGSFLGYLNPYNSAGTSVVDYCFYDNTGASDTLCLRITYDITTGIHDPQGNSFSLSAAYPNPSDWMTSVTYNLNSAKDAHLVISNMLGSVIKDTRLTDKQGALIINTSDMRPGIYCYSLLVDGKSVSSKKLVVAHH